MPASRRPTRVLVPTLALAALTAGCFSSQPVSPVAGAPPAALGSLSLSSGALGDATIVPTACEAGDRQFFLGGDFLDEKTGLVVRLVVDPLEGPAVRVFRAEKPFEGSRVFHRPDCAVFHFSLDSTGVRINRVEDYRLTLDVDCRSRDGDRLSGQASTTHCH